MDNLEIAKICHKQHSLYVETLGQETGDWADLPQEHKATVISSIVNIASGSITSPRQSHDNFVKRKLAAGWTFGETHSHKNMTNPRLVEYDLLSTENKIKEGIFFGLVIALSPKINRYWIMDILLKKLLETVESGILKSPTAYSYNLLNVVSSMNQEGLITSGEADMLRAYIKENMTKLNYTPGWSARSCYGNQRGKLKWRAGDMKPRIKWLKAELNKKN